jgi:hypothetical protein
MLVVGVPLLVVLAIPTESSAPKGIVIVGFVTVLVITKSVAQSRRRRHVVSATRIERDETWLRGVHEVVVRALVA